MKKCPRCKGRLKSETYEGFRVDKCETCHGHLVKELNLRGIKSKPEKTKAELKREAEADYSGEPMEPVNCPYCFRKMELNKIHFYGLPFYVDVCRKCKAQWLDGGELAMYQIQHETSSAFKTTEEIRKRAEAYYNSPEGQADFERKLAQLPENFSKALGPDDMLEIALGNRSRDRFLDRLFRDLWED